MCRTKRSIDACCKPSRIKRNRERYDLDKRSITSSPFHCWGQQAQLIVHAHEGSGLRGALESSSEPYPPGRQVLQAYGLWRGKGCVSTAGDNAPWRTSERAVPKTYVLTWSRARTHIPPEGKFCRHTSCGKVKVVQARAGDNAPWRTSEIAVPKTYVSTWRARSDFPGHCNF
jgi:hypothetical protein